MMHHQLLQGVGSTVGYGPALHLPEPLATELPPSGCWVIIEYGPVERAWILSSTRQKLMMCHVANRTGMERLAAAPEEHGLAVGVDQHVTVVRLGSVHDNRPCSFGLGRRRTPGVDITGVRLRLEQFVGQPGGPVRNPLASTQAAGASSTQVGLQIWPMFIRRGTPVFKIMSTGCCRQNAYPNGRIFADHAQQPCLGWPACHRRRSCLSHIHTHQLVDTGRQLVPVSGGKHPITLPDSPCGTQRVSRTAPSPKMHAAAVSPASARSHLQSNFCRPGCPLPRTSAPMRTMPRSSRSARPRRRCSGCRG